MTSYPSYNPSFFNLPPSSSADYSHHYFHPWAFPFLHNYDFIYNPFSSSTPSTVQKIEQHPNFYNFIDSLTPPSSETNSQPFPKDKKSKGFKGSCKGKPKKTVQLYEEGVKSLQKENRNVNSNILRNFFRTSNQSSQIEELVEKIIIRRGLAITAPQFMGYFRRLKINYGKYICCKKVRHLFADRQRKQHSAIMRILFQNFRDNCFFLQTLTSKKLGENSMLPHLQGARQLTKKLLE